ncbi:MAG: hypothetical protein ABWK00_01345 [Desulfurococcaceae archaeon]
MDADRGIAKLVARVALGLRDAREGLAELGMPLRYAKAVEEAASSALRDVDGKLYCGLCGLGPLTRRGAYLHLVRVHEGELAAMVIGGARGRVPRGGISSRLSIGVSGHPLRT